MASTSTVHATVYSNEIAQSASKCRNSFTEGLSLDANEWLENRLADFNLWVYGTGASAEGRASLDFRLATRPYARDMIINLLWLLEKLIQEYKKHTIDHELPRGRTRDPTPNIVPERSFSPWSDESSNSDSFPDLNFAPPLYDPVLASEKSIKTTLNSLGRIAIAVRRSGNRARLQKADLKYKPDDYEDLELHQKVVLLSKLSKLPEIHLLSKSDSPKDVVKAVYLSEVQQHLINSNLKRRHRFLYAQKHSLGLDRPATNVSPTPGDSKHTPEKSNKSQDRPTVSPRQQNSQYLAKTVPTATVISETFKLPQNIVPSQAATTHASLTAKKVDYPRPPFIDPKARFFKCPCCCQMLPVSIATVGKWRNHVTEDLCPYTCVLEHCTKSDVFYTTKEAWKEHHDEEHRNAPYWICFACEDSLSFQDEGVFISHVKQTHHETISEDQIPFIRTVSRRSSPAELTICPFCNKSDLDQENMLNHIAEEVHSFSLRALPWAPDDEHENHDNMKRSFMRFKNGSKAGQQQKKEQNKYFGTSLRSNNATASWITSYTSQDTSQEKRPEVLHWFEILQRLAEGSGFKNLILQHIVESPQNSDRYFIPADIFEAVDEEIVQIQLRKTQNKLTAVDEKQIRDYARTICRSKKKMFILLVCFGVHTNWEDIQILVEDQLDDTDLPLCRGHYEKRKYVLCKQEHANASFCPRPEHKLCGILLFEQWEQNEIQNFQRDQWSVQAPVFWSKQKGEIPHVDLPERTIMPFVEDNESTGDEERGGYGEVWSVRIHSAHQNVIPSTEKEPLLAVKRFYREFDFQQENINLRALTKKGHPHLMGLLATYRVATRYHFLFPFAKSNLRQYWNYIEMIPRTKENILWILEQLKGLVSALAVIHVYKPEIPKETQKAPLELDRFTNSKPHGPTKFNIPSDETYGRHGDIKPENILLVDKTDGSPSLLQITDFGLGKFHRVESRSIQDPSRINGSATYSPPELASGIKVSRAYDIWSLGCTFLEFLTWLCMGKRGLEEFSLDRVEVGANGWEDDYYYKDNGGQLGDASRTQVRPSVAA